MAEEHVVRIVRVHMLRCFSCGQTFTLAEVEAAAKHLDNGGPKVLQPMGMYPCKKEGCTRTFESEHGLRMHEVKGHKVNA